MTATEFQTTILPAYGAMLAVARRILSDDGADAVQEVMKKLWERHQSLDATMCGAAYACRAVRNRCLDILRCRPTTADVPLDNVANTIADDSENDNSEQLAQLAAAIDALGEPRRTILRLSLDGKAGAEIAAAVNISEANVRQYLSRTRKELRKTILSQTADL